MQWMKAGRFFALRGALPAALPIVLSVALTSWLAASAAAQTAGSAGSAVSGAAAPPVQPDKAKAYYHYSLGHLLQERGALFNRPELMSQAMDEMQLALQYDPSSSFLSMELADLYAATGRWRSALQEVEDNVRRNPNDPAARSLLGRLYVRLLSGDRGATAPPELQQRAVEEFEQIVERNPTDMQSFLILAQLYRASDESAKAEDTLKKALALEPDSSDASTQLAMLYMDVGDFRAAIDLLQRITAKDDTPELISRLAYAYEQTHDYRAAATAYGRALERDPENPAYRRGLAKNLLYSRNYDQALEEYQTAVRANPRDAESYLRMSQVYRAKGKYDLARESLTQAAELAPDNLEIPFNLVLLDETEGKTEDAINRIKQVLAASAKAGPNYYTSQEKTNRGIFLEKLGGLYLDEHDFPAAEDIFTQMQELGGETAVRGRARLIETYQSNREYDKALAASAEAVKENPQSRELATARASLLAAAGDADGAVQVLQPLMNGGPDDRDLWLALSQIHLRAKQFDQAIQATAKAEALSDSEEEKSYIFFLYGSIWERQKEFGKAEEQFRKALELNPQSAMTLNYLGYMFADQGVHLEEAVELIQRALQMEPNSGAYLDSLGWAYFKQDRIDLAEQYLQKAVDRIPTDPTIRAHLGDVYFKSGRTSQAVEEWKRALQEWNGLPESEVDEEEIASLEQKLRQAGAL
ncbi:MAG: tetratricopeptide repeat protein [Acidobacteria bacterium]|nr:tetratricopeptide repeat protein [Acidobacteriota bacterium]